MSYKNFIIDMLKKASEISVDYFGKVNGITKVNDNNQVLTKADLEIGKFIIGEIKANYPEMNIIDEEAGVIDNKSEDTWVIDPIDGTSNFANGVPTYGIMLGLLHQDKPIAGGIALPYFNEIYLAEIGGGAFCNDISIKISQETKLSSVLVAYGIDGHQEKPELTEKEMAILNKLVLNIRNLRTSNSAFDTAMVAKGRYGALLNQTSKIWDNVAQQVIIEEAGGKYTDFWGKPVNYENPLTKAKDNFTFCAAAPVLHQQIQEIILKTGN
jgi:myo-inositol-1(or 4)-monophosphatase